MLFFNLLDISRPKIIFCLICKEINSADLRKVSYLSTPCDESLKVLTDLVSFVPIVFHLECPGWPFLQHNAASFSQREWLCVLQLIHDDNSFPAEQLSCWDERNRAKFALVTLLSVKYWKKKQTFKIAGFASIICQAFFYQKNFRDPVQYCGICYNLVSF